MSYYNIRKTFFILSSTTKVEETKKIDRFLTLLEKSGVFDLINKQVIYDEENKGGRSGYNVYNMLALKRKVSMKRFQNSIINPIKLYKTS